MDLGAITNALGGLLGGGDGGQQQPQPQQPQGGGGGGFSISPEMIGALMPAAMGLIKSAGGIGGIIEKFTGGDDEEAAKSWVADGPNAPISPEHMRAALGPDIDRVAQQAGVPVAEAEAGLAQLLPQVVDKMTPGGQMPSRDDIGSITDSLFK
jgi:uncharacterized protein YidB (DUF937 family)